MELDTEGILDDAAALEVLSALELTLVDACDELLEEICEAE